MITSDTAAALYAIDPETQEILGSTRAGETGMLASELGICMDNLEDEKIHSMTINGRESYCIGRKAGSVLLLRSNLKKTIQTQILVNTLLLSAYFLMMCVIILTAIYLFLDWRITKAFANVNQKLDEVEKGDTGVSFAETATPEFATLCDHINAMKKSIMDYPQKLSRSLEAARIHIGVIESVPGYKRVIVTPEVKDFLQITAEELHALSLRPELFWEKKDGLFRRAADIGDGILQLPGPEEQYVKEERFSYGGSNIQVLIDVTKSVLEKKKLEVERDTDQMTGIYNRRAFFARLNELFQKPDSLGQAALCVMDLDNLKHINDFYGHEYGDKYLLAMAAVLKENQSERALAARLGGDEFILFFHGFADETSLNAAIDTVRNTRKTRVIHLPDGAVCGLKFSMGTAYYPKEGLNSPELIRMADERMYQEKKIRKS